MRAKSCVVSIMVWFIANYSLCTYECNCKYKYNNVHGVSSVRIRLQIRKLLEKSNKSGAFLNGKIDNHLILKHWLI